MARSRVFEKVSDAAPSGYFLRPSSTDEMSFFAVMITRMAATKSSTAA